MSEVLKLDCSNVRVNQLSLVLNSRAIREGEVAQGDLDESLRHNLSLQINLGIFLVLVSVFLWNETELHTLNLFLSDPNNFVLSKYCSVDFTKESDVKDGEEQS